jgi:hypothetical protein
VVDGYILTRILNKNDRHVEKQQRSVKFDEIDPAWDGNLITELNNRVERETI